MFFAWFCNRDVGERKYKNYKVCRYYLNCDFVRLALVALARYSAFCTITNTCMQNGASETSKQTH